MRPFPASLLVAPFRSLFAESPFGIAPFRSLLLPIQGKKLRPSFNSWRLARQDQGVDAASGGIYVLMADRLPENLRGSARAKAYDSYQSLWKQQATVVAKLPIHLRGELLGGLAQSAQRTGRTKELAEYLDKIIAVAPDTAYARAAKQWKEDPKTALDTRLTCLSCHAPGRLQARKVALDRKGNAASEVNNRLRP
jgi:hypothetical protein